MLDRLYELPSLEPFSSRLYACELSSIEPFAKLYSLLDPYYRVRKLARLPGLYSWIERSGLQLHSRLSRIYYSYQLYGHSDDLGLLH